MSSLGFTLLNMHSICDKFSKLLSGTPVLLCTAIIGLSLSACNPILRTHGYVASTENKPQEVNPDTDTKTSVLARLGNPSIRSSFEEQTDNDTWYYMNSVRQRYAYLRPQIQERNITAISFNEDGQVTQVTEYGVEDGRFVNFSNRKTPTRGRELSALEQIFGTIGRIPVDRLAGGNNQLPGGGGGQGPGGP